MRMLVGGAEEGAVRGDVGVPPGRVPQPFEDRAPRPEWVDPRAPGAAWYADHRPVRADLVSEGAVHRHHRVNEMRLRCCRKRQADRSRLKASFRYVAKAAFCCHSAAVSGSG